MTANSTTVSVARKPAKLDSNWRIQWGLHPQFPLFPHWTNRWAKKVRSKLHYFGKIGDDPKGQRALDLWNEQKDDLLAGRTPRAKTDDLTVADLCNHFLTAKVYLRDAGEIATRTFDDYKRTCARLVTQFGRNRLVTDLASDDFVALHTSIAKVWGPVALGNEIQRVRTVFKYCYDANLIQQPMRYDPMFKRPQKKVLRLNRAAKGPRLFEAADIRKMLDAADVQLKAMILLAVNCGFGNADCGTLPLDTLDLDAGWVNYHRPKTGIDRRCPLWPETIEALKTAIARRPQPKVAEAKSLLFVTKYGAPWAKKITDNPISKEFRKLLDGIRLMKRGLGFYALRHVFRTIADESRDQPAVNSIMGHADGSMAAVYRERISDERLRASAGYVRAWLFAEPAGVKRRASKGLRTAQKETSKSNSELEEESSVP